MEGAHLSGRGWIRSIVIRQTFWLDKVESRHLLQSASDAVKPGFWPTGRRAFTVWMREQEHCFLRLAET